MDDKILSINDSIHGLIELTILEKEIISCSLFNRLHDVYQNSTVYLTFPTNRTKRFEHSVGTMFLCGEMLFNSLYNASIANANNIESAFELFLSKAQIELENFKNDLITKDKIKQKFDSHERVRRFNWGDFNKNFIALEDSHIKKRLLYFASKTVEEQEEQQRLDKKIALNIVYQSARVAALLHDVGHPPFSHITEKALRILREEQNLNSASTRAKEFIEIYDGIKKRGSKKKKQLHEIIGGELVDNIFDDIIRPNDTKDPEFYKTIYRCLVWRSVQAILNDEEFWCEIHKIIDGEVDCDRMDYVVRDGVASGINNSIEYQRIISGMQLKIRKENNRETFVFAFGAKTLGALEDFFLKRMQLYKNVIFHHRVIKTDRLFKDVIKGLGEVYLNQQQSNESENENDINDISFLWRVLQHLNSVVDTKDLFLSQWDDSCLITILKQELSKLRKLNLKNALTNEELVIMDKLDEILTNKKYYFSAIKRGYDFDVVDKEFSLVIKRKVTKYLKEKKQPNHYDGITDKISILNDIAKGQKIVSSAGVFTSKIFAINYVRKMIWDDICDYWEVNRNASFEVMLTWCINKAIRDYNGNTIKIEDALIEINGEKGRVWEEVYLYRTHKPELLALTKESNINDMVELCFVNSPCFYIFIKKYPLYQNYLETNTFLNIVGKNIGEVVASTIIKYLESLNNEEGNG